MKDRYGFNAETHKIFKDALEENRKYKNKDDCDISDPARFFPDINFWTVLILMNKAYKEGCDYAHKFYENDIRRLESYEDEALEDNKDLSLKLDELQEENKHLKSEIKELHEIWGDYKACVDRYKKENEELKDEVSNFRLKNHILERDIEGLKSENEELKKQLEIFILESMTDISI